MTFIEAISASLQSRSSTFVALRERLLQPAPQQAATQATSPQTAQALRAPQVMESARLMMESREEKTGHVPVTGRTSLSNGSMTAAYLTEMRLQQELAEIQEKMSK